MDKNEVLGFTLEDFTLFNKNYPRIRLTWTHTRMGSFSKS